MTSTRQLSKIAREAKARRNEQVQQFLEERLRLSAIPLEAARYAGIRAMTALEAREQGLELPSYCSAGFLIPYYDMNGKRLSHIWRWRNSSSEIKYAQPSDTGCWVYFPRVKGLDWCKVLADPKIPVIIVEGELKALSLCLAGVLAVAIGGVWNWSLHKGLLPELQKLAAQQRCLYIGFDSDTENNQKVKAARYSLAKALLDERAQIYFLNIPHIADSESTAKTGADDLVRVWKKRDDELQQALFALAEDFALQQHLHRCNAKYMFVQKDAKVYRVDDPETFSWRYHDFMNVIESQPCAALDKKGKEISVGTGKAWLVWPGRNEVEERVYEPGQATPYLTTSNGRRCWNNWTGWVSLPEPDPEGIKRYWTRLLDHLFGAQRAEIAKQAEERERCRRWFEMWLAYPLQHPGAKLFSAVAMLGAQGGGKTMVGEVVGHALYGPHFSEITQEVLGNKFNEQWIANKSFVMASEITNTKDFERKRGFAELLKHWVTGRDMRVEEKFVPQYQAKNFVNFYFTSNHPDAFFVEDDDRRYFIWEIPPVKLADALTQRWVDDAFSYLKSEKGKAALHHHLLHLPIDARLFDPHKPPPETEAKRNAKEYSQNELERWVDEFYEDPEGKTNKPEETVWRLEDIYPHFLRDVKSNYSKRAFMMAFRKKFATTGQSLVRVFKNHRPDKQTKVLMPQFERRKTGLWMKKPDYGVRGDSHFPTNQEAKDRWEKQIQRIDEEAKLALSEALKKLTKGFPPR